MRKRITPLLIALLAALPLVIVVIAGITGTRTVHEVQVQHIKRLLNTHATDVAHLTAEYLEPTEHVLEVGAGLSEQGLIDFRQRETAELYLLESLASNPRVTGVYWAADDGSFLYVYRDEGTSLGGFTTKWIDGSDPEAGATLTMRDVDRQVRAERVDPNDGFDPRTRPWYEAATAQLGVAWTDAYLFYTADAPGISAAVAITHGPSPGVLGADIPLAQLGRFIEGDQQVAASARVFLVDDGKLIVHGRPEVLALDGEDVGPAIDDLSDAPSRIAGLTAAGGNGWTALEIEGDTYHSSSATIPLTGWTVVIVAPEEDFTQTFDSAQRTNLLMLGLIAAGALVLAIPLSRLTLRNVGSLRHEAHSDSLTRLMNRRSFEDQAERMLDAAARRRRSTGAIMVDIDHFKRLNDAYGHHAGDEILKAIAGRVRHAVPKSDIVGRLGGDELSVIVENADLVATRAVANRIHGAVTDTPISTPRGPVYVTVSLGAAATDGLEEVTLDYLLKAADRALYASKRAGRNRVTAVSSELQNR